MIKCSANSQIVRIRRILLCYTSSGPPGGHKALPYDTTRVFALVSHFATRPSCRQSPKALPTEGMQPGARTRLRETLAHFRAEKCFFRGACPRKKRIGLIFRLPRRKTLRGFFCHERVCLQSDPRALCPGILCDLQLSLPSSTSTRIVPPQTMPSDSATSPVRAIARIR